MSPLLFLVPAFLAGLAALVIPILVHLRRKQKAQVVSFPSLMFLEKVPYQAEERRQIQHWLLLLLRALALVLLVGAFARPFVDRSEAAAGTTTGPREIVILVDRSYSMGVGDRWDQAMTASRAAVDALGSLDRASVVFFGASPEIAVRSTADKIRLRMALDSAKVSSQATRYGRALQLAQTIFEESELPSFELVMISDFQRSGWTGEEGVYLPEGTSVRMVPLAESAVDNVSVAGVSLTRQRFSGVERMLPVARVTRVGGEQPLTLTAVLEVDGREVESKEVSLPASGAAQVEFQPFVLSARHMKGTVRVGTDALPPDNAYHFVVSPGAATGVVLVGDAVTSIGGNARRSSLYLQSALATTEEGGFDVTMRGSAPAEADLEGKSVVILHDTPFPGGNAGTALRRFVEGGGGLIVATGERTSWPADHADLFPGQLGPVLDKEQRGGRLGELDYSHPVFEIFAGPRSGDFTSTRFFRTRGLNVTAPDSVRVLARFDDGAVALAEKRVGEGRVLLWTSTLDNFWNDLALQPVYLPLVHQMTRYASGRGDAVTSFLAGHVIDVSDEKAMESAGLGDVAGELQEGERVVISPDGEGVALRSAGGPLYISLDDQGFYDIRPQGRGDAVRPLAVAVNVDLAEADLTPLDPQEVVAAVTSSPPDGAAPRRTTRETELNRVAQERNQQLWKVLLLLAFVVLIVETVISNRLSTGAAKRGIHA
jgi:hypothetical protein